MSETEPAALPAGRYRLRHVVRSELVKLATVPSTAITLAVTVVLGLLVTSLVTHNTAIGRGPFFDSTQVALTGLIVAALTAGVFGAIVITSEYSSGTMRATLSAAPNRPLLLAAKTGVTAVVTVVVAEVLSFVSFFLGQAILSSRGAPTASIGSSATLRAVVMTGVFVALLALMSFGFGLILRSTAGAIAAFVGVVFVLPLVMHGISRSGVRYLPTMILTNSIMSTVNQVAAVQGPKGASGPPPFGGPLSPTVGLALMALYAAVVLGIGAASFVKRDA